MIPTRDIALKEGAGLLWLAPANLGGLSPADFAARFESAGPDMIRAGLILPVGLYAEAGFVSRLTFEPLTAQESEEWVACAKGPLSLASDGLCLGSTLAPDYFETDFSQFERIKHNQSCALGALIDTAPGHYWVEIYHYLPSELSGAHEYFLVCEDIPEVYRTAEPEAETPHAWFSRTRPNETPPRWISGQGNHGYLDFLIQLTPLTAQPPDSSISPIGEDGLLAWSYRKPERCPLGIACDL